MVQSYCYMCLSWMCKSRLKEKMQIDWTLKKTFTTDTCHLKVSLCVQRFSKVQKRILILEQLGEEAVTARVKSYPKTRKVWGRLCDENSLTPNLGQNISEILEKQDSPTSSLLWVSGLSCRQQHHTPKPNLHLYVTLLRCSVTLPDKRTNFRHLCPNWGNDIVY